MKKLLNNKPIKLLIKQTTNVNNNIITKNIIKNNNKIIKNDNVKYDKINHNIDINDINYSELFWKNEEIWRNSNK